MTPLFFIGAALGNLLSQPLDIPLGLAAGVGMAAVFAAASNTPVALSIMAAELLGIGALPHAPLVCVLAYLFTGPRSIYPAQRRLQEKWNFRREHAPSYALQERCVNTVAPPADEG